MRLTDKNTIISDLKRPRKQFQACRCIIRSSKKDRTAALIRYSGTYKISEGGFVQKMEAQPNG